jgi:hypothetical protein
MENTNKAPKKTWYDVLEDRFNTLMVKFDMPEDISHEIYSFVTEVAKEQYKSGNKSGISWLLKKQAIEGIRPRVVAAAPVAA